MTKICIKCEKEKELKEFRKRKKSKDGYGNQCNPCLNDIAKIRHNNLIEEEKKQKRIRKNERNKEYLKSNPEFKLRQKKRRRENHLKRMEDPLYKLKISFSRRLNKLLKRVKCNKSTNKPYYLDKLGCSFEEFKIYLESKFEDWMTWKNYGLYNGELNYGWDIDHIIPSSTAKNENDIYHLSHYSNLQPLCSKTNRDIKKDKIKNPQ